MKIIHCGDLHLDSAMTSNLDRTRAKQRRNEILETFGRMVEYARQEGVSVILIAGDLFDTTSISKKTRNYVSEVICGHPDIQFLYLKGNHDTDNFLSTMDCVPDNLKFFGSDWVSYRYGNVVISGMELESGNAAIAASNLKLASEDVNIVVLHGQEVGSVTKEKAEIININAYKDKFIDYLALGHIHTYKEEKLDRRGVWCYCGCLEGRGFDECGPKGFVMLDTDGEGISRTFVPFGYRTMLDVSADVTNLMSSREILQKVREVTKDLDKKNLVKLRLTGQLDIQAECSPTFILNGMQDVFFFMKIQDETTLHIDAQDYRYDASLKGEFIRLVLEQNLEPEEQKQIIETGLAALAGEELPE